MLLIRELVPPDVYAPGSAATGALNVLLSIRVTTAPAAMLYPLGVTLATTVLSPVTSVWAVQVYVATPADHVAPVILTAVSATDVSQAAQDQGCEKSTVGLKTVEPFE